MASSTAAPLREMCTAPTIRLDDYTIYKVEEENEDGSAPDGDAQGVPSPLTYSFFSLTHWEQCLVFVWGWEIWIDDL